MRKLDPGDIAAKLDRIEKAGRSRRWKKAARAHLLADVGGETRKSGSMVDLPKGKTVCTKRRFRTYGAAILALIATATSPNPARREQRIYLCNHCQAYHLSSKEYSPK